MRCTQYYGLPEDANKFLSKSIKLIPDVVCPDCNKVFTEKWATKIYKTTNEGCMFDDEAHDLIEYELKDGTIVRQVIQAVPWSSGPCIFLKLVKVNDDGSYNNLFEWSKEEIEQSI